jgi:hypothetical protein
LDQVTRSLTELAWAKTCCNFGATKTSYRPTQLDLSGSPRVAPG